MTIALHPKEATSLIGHENLIANILKNIDDDKLHHAWLLTGPKGVGKSTFAYQFIRHLLSPHQESGPSLFGDAPLASSFSWTDQVNRLVESNSHPDLKVIEYDAATAEKKEIGVDEVRAAINFLYLTSFEGGKRIILIDAVDDLNRNAANALLKALEEPPASAHIILISHQPGLLLPTIKSRCRQLAFGPLNDADITSYLRRRFHSATEEDIALAVAAGRGSLGESIHWLTPDIHDLMADMADIFAKLPSFNHSAALGFSTKIAGKNYTKHYNHFAQLLPWLLHQAVLLKTGQADGAKQPSLVKQFSTSFSIEDCMKSWEKVSEILKRAEVANLDKKESVMQVLRAVAN